MLTYLLENHIYFFMYLTTPEIIKLSQVDHSCFAYFSDDIWYQIFRQHHGFKRIDIPRLNYLENSISLSNRQETHHRVISVDRDLIRKNKPKSLYCYLNLFN